MYTEPVDSGRVEDKVVGWDRGLILGQEWDVRGVINRCFIKQSLVFIFAGSSVKTL